MSVNGITGATNTYDAYQTSQAASTKAAQENTSGKTSEEKDEAGVVYEASKNSASSAKTYTQNTDLVNKTMFLIIRNLKMNFL